MSIGSERYYAHKSGFAESVKRTYRGRASEDAILTNATDGSIKLMDALALRDQLVQERPASVLEIGSFLGFSTRWILEATEASGAHLTSVDPGIRHRIFDDVADHVRSYCSSYAARHTIRQAFVSEANYNYFLAEHLKAAGDAAQPRPFLEQIEAIEVLSEPFGAFDFAFVDGDHSYRATVLNLELVARMVRAQGVIVVHDALTWPDVVPAVRNLAAASDGALEVIGIYGEAFHEQAAWRLSKRIVPENARFACGTLCDGLAALRVNRPFTLPPVAMQKLLDAAPKRA